MISKQQIVDKLKKNEKYWIVFTGDSITSCEWVHPNWREIVEYVLKDKLNYSWGIKGFNFAYDGSTTRDIVDRLDEIYLVRPDLVICMIGANDPFQEIEIKEYKSNIAKIISEADKHNYECVLSTDNCPVDSWSRNEYQPYVDEIKNLPGLVNLFEESKKFPIDRIYTFKAEKDIPAEHLKKGDRDYWHPNQLGNCYIAKIVLDKIFGIKFDPEKYWSETLAGEKLPRY